MRVSMGYPSRDAELAILVDPRRGRRARAHPAGRHRGRRPRHGRRGASGVHVAPALAEYLVDLAEATRRHPAIALGMSPRATLSLQRVARARAAAAGRDYVMPDDVKALAVPVLAHRILVTPEAQLGWRDRSRRPRPTCCGPSRSPPAPPPDPVTRPGVGRRGRGGRPARGRPGARRRRAVHRAARPASCWWPSPSIAVLRPPPILDLVRTRRVRRGSTPAPPAGSSCGWPTTGPAAPPS